MDSVAVVLLQAEGERAEARDRPGDADRGGGVAPDLVGDAFRKECAHRGCCVVQFVLQSDPPTQEDLDDAAAAVRALLAERVPDEIRSDISSAIGVAGTITSLGALAVGLDEYDRDRVHGFELTAEALDEQLRRLASVPLEERRRMRPLDPDRAPVIVGGAVIAREVHAYFGLDVLEISERDILDGAARAAAELPEEEEGAAPPGAYTCC